MTGAWTVIEVEIGWRLLGVLVLVAFMAYGVASGPRR